MEFVLFFLSALPLCYLLALVYLVPSWTLGLIYGKSDVCLN